MRIKSGTRKRHKKIKRKARGYYGQKSRTFKKANEAVLRSLSYAYRHRKEKKRNFRSLWIVRINAAARDRGIQYNDFIYGLAKAGISLNRKQLSELAINQPETFDHLVAVAKENLS